jgi:nucleoside-diphosphate-sugar epimerase
MELEVAKGPVLIVGGAGYFGARLAEDLGKTHKVTITRRTGSTVREKWIRKSGFETVEFDSAKMDAIAVSGYFQAVINLAMPGAVEAASDPGRARLHALKTAAACLRLMDQTHCPILIHFSTFHVYGGGGRIQFSEADAPAPVHPYGEVHLACERFLEPDQRVWIVRPSNMVGAPAHGDLGDQAKLLFVDLCRQAAKGRMSMHNDGLSYRDFLPFDDAIAAVRVILTASPMPTRLLNLAHGHAMRLDEAARLIQRVAPVPPTVEFGSGKDAFRRPFKVNIERLLRLGWEPSASLTDEAARLVQFFQ